MYRTGEWMLENGKITYNDPFSYTFSGTNWINVKWFFEILIVFFKGIAGPEAVFILQGIVSVSILFILVRTTNLICEKQKIAKDNLYYFSLFLMGMIFLISFDFRMIGRPEMCSHFFTAAYLYIFLNFKNNNKSKVIYWLIPLQLLWANLHEGFGTGMVLIIAFFAANFLEYYLGQNKSFPKNLGIVSLAAILAVSVNPRGPVMLFHPINIFNQLKENQYTTELFDFKNPAYWQKEAYLNLLFLMLSLVFIGIHLFKKTVPNPVQTTANKKEKSVNTRSATAEIKQPEIQDSFFKTFGFSNILMFFLLFYLSLTAYRNIPFFLIAAFPLTVLCIHYFLSRIVLPNSLLYKILPYSGLALGLLFYVGIVSNWYQKNMGIRDEYGLQILNGHNPVAAADFIEKNNIKGRCFADYLSSSYLLWRLKPDFKTYIDLRDLDIFPNNFFERYNMMLQNPQIFEEEDKKQNFEYVVLLRRNMEAIPYLYKYLFDSPNYALVFADPVALVYLKNTDRNKSLIEKYALESDNKRDIFKMLETSKSSAFASVLNKIFNPLFQNRSYEDIDQFVIAAHIYYTMGISETALAYSDKSIKKGISGYRPYEIKGLVYARQYFDPATAAEKKSESEKLALESFNQSLQLNKNSLESLYGKAVLLIEGQKYTDAISLLQQAQKIAPQNPNIQQQLTSCYSKLEMKK
jgi:hypothetical protein